MTPLQLFALRVNGLPEWQSWGCLLAVALVVALSIATPAGSRRAASCKHCSALMQWAARNRKAMVLFFFLLPIVMRLSLLPLLPPPVAVETDDFSYLLGADTLMHLRLTNPPPPHPEFFEAEHINVLPTYESMYPPGQAAFLALGKLLFRNAWAGVLISVGAMCAALYWAMVVLVPVQWAIFATALCALHFGIASEFTNSYMGGAVAAFAAALLVGSLRRAERLPRLWMYLLAALALLLLANSRPYEGFLFAIIPCCVFLVHYWRHRHEWKHQLPALSAAVLVLLAGAIWMGYYNFRGTGHALEMPYQANWKQYHITRLFLWQPRQEVPQFNHAQMRNNAIRWEYLRYLELLRPGGFYRQELEKIQMSYAYYLQGWGILAVLSLLAMLRSPKLRTYAGVLLLMALGAMALSWPVFPRYDSPALVLFMVVLVHGLRRVGLARLRMTGRTVELGRALRPLAATFISGVVLLNVATAALSAPAGIASAGRATIAGDAAPDVQSITRRYAIERQLEQMPGRHVVLVYYPPDSTLEAEWAYNSANIDAQKVIWALDMGAHDSVLMQQYPDREFWTVNETDPLGRLRRVK